MAIRVGPPFQKGRSERSHHRRIRSAPPLRRGLRRRSSPFFAGSSRAGCALHGERNTFDVTPVQVAREVARAARARTARSRCSSRSCLRGCFAGFGSSGARINAVALSGIVCPLMTNSCDQRRAAAHHVLVTSRLRPVRCIAELGFTLGYPCGSDSSTNA